MAREGCDDDDEDDEDDDDCCWREGAAEKVLDGIVGWCWEESAEAVRGRIGVRGRGPVPPLLGRARKVVHLLFNFDC